MGVRLLVLFILGAGLGYLLSLYQEKIVLASLDSESTPLSNTRTKIIFSLVVGILFSLADLAVGKYIVLEIIYLVAILCLSSIFIIDLCHCIIFDLFQIVFFVCAVAETIFENRYGVLYNVKSHIIGMVVGFLFFFLIAMIGKKIYKKEAMGQGDIILALSAGLFLGWQRFILAIFIATFFGSIILLLIKKLRSDEDGKEYPFAPFLSFGIVFSMFLGIYLIEYYLSLFMF